jgi:ribosomal protein S12 methylthiotransferase accessory factor
VRIEFAGILTSDALVRDSGHASDPVEAFFKISSWAQFANVTRLAETTRLDKACLPTFYAVRPQAIHPSAIISSGKGTTRASAALSALFEAHERWAAERPPDDPIYATGNELNDGFPGVLCVAPKWLARTERIPWTVSFELCEMIPCFVPYQKVAFPSIMEASQPSTIESDTNGLASGTNAMEAICSGILELIERDAIQRFARHQKAKVDIASLPDALAKVADAMRDCGVELSVFWCPSPTGIPVFYCLSRDDHFEVSSLFCSGAGAHVSSEIALMRTLTEVAQSRASFISSLREDISGRIEQLEGDDFERRKQSLSEWFDSESSAISFSTIRTFSFPAFSAQLTFIIDRVRSSRCGPISCTPLRRYPELHAFRVYCPTLLSPSPTLQEARVSV